jgi:hypothetical protein
MKNQREYQTYFHGKYRECDRKKAVILKRMKSSITFCTNSTIVRHYQIRDPAVRFFGTSNMPNKANQKKWPARGHQKERYDKNTTHCIEDIAYRSGRGRLPLRRTHSTSAGRGMSLRNRPNRISIIAGTVIDMHAITKSAKWRIYYFQKQFSDSRRKINLLRFFAHRSTEYR